MEDELRALEDRTRRCLGAGDWPGAIDAASRHADHTQQRFGDRTLAHARSLFNLSEVYEAASDLSRARSLIDSSLEILETLGDPADAALVLTRRYAAILDHKLGRDLTAEAAAFVERRPCVDDLNRDGLQLHAQGRYREAALRFTEAVSQCDRMPLLDQERATALDNLGMVRHDTGELGEALRLHLEALAIFRRLDLGRDLATALHNAGSVYLTLRRPEAEGFLERALEIRRQYDNPIELAMTLAELGGLRLAQGRPDDAETLLSEALRVYDRGGLRPDEPVVLKASINLAQTQPRDRDNTETLAGTLDALAAGRARLPRDHPDMIGLLLAPVGSLLALSRLDEATALVVEAVDLADQILPPVHPARAEALHLLADVHLRAGRMSNAAAVLRQVAPVDDQLLARSAAIGIDRLRRLTAYAMSVQTSALLATLHEHFRDDPTVVRIVYESVIHRKGLLQETEAVARRATGMAADPAVAELVARLSRVRRELAQRTLRGPRHHGMKSSYALQQQLQTLAREPTSWRLRSRGP